MLLGTWKNRLPFQSALRDRPNPMNKEWLLTKFRASLLPQFESDLASLEITIEDFEKRLQPYLEVRFLDFCNV